MILRPPCPAIFRSLAKAKYWPAKTISPSSTASKVAIITPERSRLCAAGSIPLTRVTEKPPRPSGCVSTAMRSPGKKPSPSVGEPLISKNCTRGDSSNRSPASTIKSSPTSPTNPSMRISSWGRVRSSSAVSGGPRVPSSNTATSTATGCASPNCGGRVTTRKNAPFAIEKGSTANPS